jgi:hypothetical protein
MRLPNPDTGAGKSNGYRVLYAVAVEHKLVVILTVYYKKEVATIRDSAIRGMIDSFVSEQFSKNEETDR